MTTIDILHDPENIEITTENETYTGWFTEERVNKNDLPEHLYAYEIRGGDEIEFATLEPEIYVNFTGTFITDTPVKMEVTEDDEYIEITDYGFI